MKRLIDEAERLGFTKSVYLSGLRLECRPELRAYCETCPQHGQNWVCPPGCGALEACQRRADAFREGLLLQSQTALTPPVAAERYKTLQREHNLRLKALIGSAKGRYSGLLPLSTGGCVFCDVCAYPGPCRHPDIKMESLSAFGIDAGKLCGQAGIPFSFSENHVSYMALLMVKL